MNQLEILIQKLEKEIMELFNKLHKEGKTVILITHDLNLVRYGERIVILRDGKVSNEKM